MTELGRGDAWESGTATLQANVTRDFASTGSISIRCYRRNNSGSPKAAVARKTKIIAIRVGSTTRSSVSG